MKGLRLHLSVFAVVLLGVGCGDAEDAAPSRFDAGFPFRFDAAADFPDWGASSPGDASFPLVDAAAPYVCDPIEQDCVSSTDKCVVDLGPTACVPRSDGDRPRGIACLPGECEPGLACTRTTETATQATCAKVCNLESGGGCGPLGPDFECRARIAGTTWGACRELEPTCDPITQAPCADAYACQPFLRRTGAWEFRCRVAGSGQADQRCDGALPNCARGLACVSTPRGTASCRVICANNRACTPPEQCVGVVEQPPFNFCAL